MNCSDNSEQVKEAVNPKVLVVPRCTSWFPSLKHWPQGTWKVTHTALLTPKEICQLYSRKCHLCRAKVKCGLRTVPIPTLQSIEHQTALSRKCHIYKHGSANWWCAHTHTHRVCIYYVTLLPCALKTEDMTEATANSSIFIFFFIVNFTFQENKGNCEWKTHWYLRNRYQYL